MGNGALYVIVTGIRGMQRFSVECLASALGMLTMIHTQTRGQAKYGGPCSTVKEMKTILMAVLTKVGESLTPFTVELTRMTPVYSVTLMVSTARIANDSVFTVTKQSILLDSFKSIKV